MEAKKIAHNERGELSIVMVEGRSFVHGSILDEACYWRDQEIERLRAALKKIADENPYNDNGHHFVVMAKTALGY